MEVVVGKKFRVCGQKIGSGSFGDVFVATNKDSGEKVGLKFEHVNTREPQLQNESKIYRILHNDEGSEGIPKFFDFGVQGLYNFMAIELLGPSLNELFTECGCRFTLKTVLMVADQVLTRLEFLHSRFFVHRSIKPHNVLIGLKDKQSVIYLIDFGRAKGYRHPESYEHIPYRDGRRSTQRPEFSSINAHLDIEQSRRDDVSSVGYMLVYFLKGSLPWENTDRFLSRRTN